MFSWFNSYFYGNPQEDTKSVSSDPNIEDDKKGLADSLLNIEPIKEQSVPDTIIVQPLEKEEDDFEVIDKKRLEKLYPAAARECPVENVVHMPKSMVIITLKDIQTAINKLNHVETNGDRPQEKRHPLMAELHNKFNEKKLSEKNIEITGDEN